MAQAILLLILVGTAIALPDLKGIETIDIKKIAVFSGQEMRAENDITLRFNDTTKSYYHAIDLTYQHNLIDVLAFDQNEQLLKVTKSTTTSQAVIYEVALPYTNEMYTLKIYEIYNQRLTPFPQKIKLSVICLPRKIKKSIYMITMDASHCIM